MENLIIEKIGVLEDGKLRVWPSASSASYQHIYREASEVYWDNDLKCFYSPVPREWDYKKWFGQIVSVVRSGLGVVLNVTDETEFISKDLKFKIQMLEANEQIQNG